MGYESVKVVVQVRSDFLSLSMLMVSRWVVFVLTIFFRREPWGQLALLAVLLVMVVVFVRRLKRTHRAFKGR